MLYPLPEVSAVLPAYRPWLLSLHNTEWAEAMAARLDWIESLAPPVEIEMLVFHPPSATPIGFVGLSAIDMVNLKGELSLAFFRGRGTRAVLEALHWSLHSCFSTLGLEKLVFHVLPDTRGAFRLLKGLGIEMEARLIREIRMPGGQDRADLLRFALFRDRWEQGEVRSTLQRLAPLAAA